MASFYPVRKDRQGPLNAQAVASSLRNGLAQQERTERRLQNPVTPAQKLHKELIAKENSLENVLRLATEAIAELDANNIATAIHKVAQLSRREHRGVAAARADSRFQDLLTRANGRAAEWSSRQLCHMAWSVAVLNCGPSPLLRAVGCEFTARGEVEHVPQDISTFAWALAVAQFCDADMMRDTAARALRKLPEFCPQDLSITAWAFAKLLVDDRRPLMLGIARQSLSTLGAFSPRNLANLSWAFATAQHRDLELCEALVDQCSARIVDFGPQELPILLWSFAACGYPSDKVFEVAADQAMSSLHGMDVSHLCNVIWSYARAGPRHDRLFAVLAEEARRRLTEMEPLHLANLAWSFANVQRADEFDLRRVGVRHAPLFAGLAAAAGRLPGGLQPQHSASMLWAFGACSVAEGADVLADVVHRSMLRDAQPCEPRHAAGMLWSMAVLRLHHAPLCNRILDGVTGGGVAELARDGPAHLASVAWSAARLSCAAHPALRTTMRSSVDGLLAALAGSLAELSEGRRQNIAAVVRALYDMDMADTARALLIRTEDLEVKPGSEAWSAWLCGAACRGDAELEQRAWLGLAASVGDGLPYDAPRHSAVLNAASVRALAVGRQDLAVAALEALGADGASPVTAALWRRAGQPGRCAGEDGCVSPRGECSEELKVAQLLMFGARQGDPEALLGVAEACALHDERGWAHEALGFGVGVRGATLDAALETLVAVDQPIIVHIGCGIGCGAIRTAQRLRGSGRWRGRIVACEVDGFAAAVALNLVEWAGLGDVVDVKVGKSMQLLPWLREECGPSRVVALILSAQGTEYREDLERAEALRLLAPGALVLADRVLAPPAPELLQRMCGSAVFEAASAVTLPDGDCLMLARYRAAAAEVPPQEQCWPPAPSDVRQLQHDADEARRRSGAWRRRDRLSQGTPQTRPEDLAAAAEGCRAVGLLLPPPVRPMPRGGGRLAVELPEALRRAG